MHHGVSSPSSTEFVNLSLHSFAFWWLIILNVHLLTCAYNAAFAKFYWDFDASFLSYSLESYGIGIPRENFLAIAYVHVVLACAHGACVLHMIAHVSWKMLTRRCELSGKTCMGSDINVARMTRRGEDRTGCIVTRIFTRVYKKVAHRHGFFGVNGKYFHAIHVFREILETALQTGQAVRLSKYLPRPQLNHFYVGLLVINCWSSVIVYSRWFWRGEAQRRFALVVSDCVLDMMATVGVSVMIVLGYVDQYDVQLAGFKFDVLNDDNWVAQMLNEAQMVLVVSWSDMAMRVIFSLGIIITTTNMKELLRYSPNLRSAARVQAGRNLFQVDPLAHLGASSTMLQPPACSNTNSETRLLKPSSTNTETVVRTTGHPNRFHGIHALFALWGFVVLILHVHAVAKVPLVECIPKVHPMAGALPSCFVVNFNCHSMDLSGTIEKVQSEWEQFDRKTAVKLYILHCSEFGMPVSFQDFSQLQEVRIYNSTLSDWTEHAAFTNSHHPKLKVVSVVRSNMKNGVLPLGFQSFDFPVSLFEINFCETNLESIPNDIDSKWHIGSSVYVENCRLTIVPPALIRLQPYYLVLGGNPIKEVPSELFETTGMLYLILGRTNITMLPQTILHPTSSAPFVDVRNTAVSFFWSWMDPLVETMLEVSPMILASGSTYCNDLDKIMSGTAQSFSASFQADYSSLLMNASEQNWELLRHAVDCTPTQFSTTFSVWDWDEMYSLEK